jgi:hypothetical protein
VNADQDRITFFATQCFLCKQLVSWIRHIEDGEREEFRIWPLGATRPIPDGVPEPIAALYQRACRQIGFDDTSAAAWARTTLEKLLDARGIPKAEQTKTGRDRPISLYDRIQTFLDRTELTTRLRANVDSIRKAGNFIHMNENVATGDVVEIATDEAIWVLDILEGLFRELYELDRRQAEIEQRFAEKVASTEALPGDQTGGENLEVDAGADG